VSKRLCTNIRFCTNIKAFAQKRKYLNNFFNRLVIMNSEVQKDINGKDTSNKGLFCVKASFDSWMFSLKSSVGRFIPSGNSFLANSPTSFPSLNVFIVPISNSGIISFL